VRWLLTGLALVALRRGELQRAGTLWGAVEAAEQEAPIITLDPALAPYIESLASCDDAGFRAGLEAGRLSTLASTVTFALVQDETSGPGAGDQTLP
jgi:hypothetical protein